MLSLLSPVAGHLLGTNIIHFDVFGGSPCSQFINLIRYSISVGADGNVVLCNEVSASQPALHEQARAYHKAYSQARVSVADQWGPCFQIEAFLLLLPEFSNLLSWCILAPAHVLGFDVMAGERYDTRKGVPSRLFFSGLS